MTPYYFHPTLLLRIPYFAYTKHKSSSLQQFMDDKAFRNALLLATPTFYEILERIEFNEASLSVKQRQTLQNYINRMHYRCTPFGLYAGTVPVKWSDVGNPEIVIGKSKTAHILPSFNTEWKILNTLKNNPHHTVDFRYCSNPTHILVGNEMRYLTASYETSKGSIKEHELKSMAVDKSFKALLSFCRKPLPANVIIQYLSQQYDMDQDESTAFFHDLVEEQILLSDMEPNITGIPYSERLHGVLNDGKEDNLLSSIKSDSFKVDDNTSLAELLKKQAGGEATANSYAHLSMSALKNKRGLHTGYQQNVLDGLYAIQKMLPKVTSTDLESFKASFIDKFDQRCVPLLEALDPELGINYAGLCNTPCEILQGLDAKNAAPQPKNIQWSEVHTMLFQKWQSAAMSHEPIILDDRALEPLPSIQQAMPSSLSSIFKIHDDCVVLDHMGSATSNAIMGRFSIFHKEIENGCRDISNTETELNPGVLFAEIVSIQDTHAANIEKRKHFYQFEIPILTASLLPAERQLQLNDLHVMVRNERLILFSAKYGKEVIPRLSTAFNYKRSTLGIYRFLCDMQFQDIRKITPFHMERFFPDLPYYPRVVYKKTILQLATWHIKKANIQHILNEKHQDQKIKQLSEYLKSLKMATVFALKEHDNQLVFKMEDQNDLLLLLENIKNNDTITLEEFPFTEGDALVKDETGAAYQHQMAATLVNNETVYEGSQRFIQQALTTLDSGKDAYMPGSNWVYLKIYCHQSFGDALLLKKIKPLLKQIKALGQVEKWFFVRYTDSGFHIRVRICMPPALQGFALELLNQSLKKELHTGLISKVQLDTYRPEWERYGHHLMAVTEDCFYTGSEWILHQLQLQDKGLKDNIEMALLHIHTIFNVAGMHVSDRKDLLLRMYQSLAAEHGIDKQGQIELGNKCRNYRERMAIWLQPGDKKHKTQTDFEKSLQRCFLKMERSSTHLKNNWISDLIHMQLNRIFSDHARKKEMVVYFLMSKWYLTEEKKHSNILSFRQAQ